jgi:DNA repair exonuclease SbcCD nuclease subunit
VKIVCTSDWHLDARTSGFARWSEVVEAVDKSLEIAKDADLYIMLGDVCNPTSRTSWSAAAYAVKVALHLDRLDVDTLWISGNHDVAEDGMGGTTLSPLKQAGIGCVAEDPKHFYKLDNMSGGVVALPFCAPERAYDVEGFVRKVAAGGVVPKLVVGHLNIHGAIKGSESHDLPRGREVYWPIDAIKEVWPDAILIGGHYHRAQVINGVQIVGSLARLAHGEEDNQPCILVLEI